MQSDFNFINKIIIRDAKEKDLEGILDIYNYAIIHTTSVYQYEPHTMEMRIKWYEDKVKNNIPILVAETNNKVAGFASYGPFRVWQAYKYSVEHSVYVHPEEQGKGIGQRLLYELIEAAKKKEVHTIIAGIDSDNAISIHLHEKFGFKETAYFKEVGYKFKRWLDLRFMQLILQNDLEPKDN